MLVIIVTLCAGVLAAAMPHEKVFYDIESAEEHFEGFIKRHSKEYATELEKQSRFEIFKQNLEEINQKNAESEHTVFGITKFSDLTPQEFLKFNNLQTVGDGSCRAIIDDNPLPGDIPAQFDWRTRNAVTNVKDQQQCGSCWAFSITGNVEGQYAIKHNNLVSFSEQELVDCDKTDYGCSGGLMENGMRALVNLGGIMSEASYPYKAAQQTCEFKKNNVAAVLTDCVHYKFSKEDNMRSTLYTVGPLSIGVSAAPLQHYHGGILNINTCPADPVNHGVLLVGYGIENNVPYWLVKNSWGESFGLKGYFKLQRDQNTCNIASYGAASAILV